MSTPPNDAQQSFTSQAIDAWLLTAHERCAALHIQAATSSNSLEYHEAFAGISALLQQALEKVHMLNTHLRKMMHTACDRATAVQRHVTPITEASRKWGERRDGSPPSSEEIRKAESRLLEMFRDGHRQDRGIASTEGMAREQATTNPAMPGTALGDAYTGDESGADRGQAPG